MKLYAEIKPTPIREDYAKFQKNKPQNVGEILKFDGVGENDVYNPSIPFKLDGMTIIAGRVESRNNEISSTMFFLEKDGVWSPIEDAPVFNLQDPFVTFVDDELILGGVYVDWADEKTITSWKTEFYRGTSIFSLEKFTTGPPHMKDIRLLQLTDSRIAVFSRPQGDAMIKKYGCIAKIGFTIVDKIEDVTANVIENAPLLLDHFLDDEWGGCNQLFQLENGLIGVIGHKSWGEHIGGVHFLHYYSMSFAIDPNTRKMTTTKIIGSRDCFPQGQTKQPRLQDVTFTAGIVRNDDRTATLYTGLNDCQIGKLNILDPFIEYEG